MRPCIFVCAFCQAGYLRMLRLLLISIATHSPRLPVVIYTTTVFQRMIALDAPRTLTVHYMINDRYNDITRACRARYDWFRLPCAPQYDRVLYLDTDVLCMAPLEPVFDLCRDDCLYAVEEGDLRTHDPVWDYYGRTLFQESELPGIAHLTAFSSGILLFPGSPKMRDLFETVLDDFQRRPVCRFDQPYLVHHATKKGCVDNQTLRAVAILYNDLQGGETTTCTMMALVHFAGGVGAHEPKEPQMWLTLQTKNAGAFRGVFNWLYKLHTNGWLV